MARPLRIEFPGALYHVTARGDRREDIFVDDEDRQCLLDVVAQGLDRFNARALAYCLMGNHYHFVLQTWDGQLSRLMRHVNGVYTQAFNRRHNKVGHLFQGRFKAILVDKDSYLLEVCRYVDLNPVRAGMVKAPGLWPWSSYQAHVGEAPAPAWLDTQGLHGFLIEREVKTVGDQVRAAKMYQAWVAGGEGVRLWEEDLRQQIYLGDEDFVQAVQKRMQAGVGASREVPREQRRAPQPMAHWIKTCDSRDQAMYLAYTQGGSTMTRIAAELGLSVSYVSRLIKAYEGGTG